MAAITSKIITNQEVETRYRNFVNGKWQHLDSKITGLHFSTNKFLNLIRKTIYTQHGSFYVLSPFN